MLCNLQIFSGCVCHLEQLHAQSPFLFPIVFTINLIPFFDISSVLAVHSPGLFGYVLLYFTWATARSQELLFVVWLVMHFEHSTAAAGSERVDAHYCVQNIWATYGPHMGSPYAAHMQPICGPYVECFQKQPNCMWPICCLTYGNIWRKTNQHMGRASTYGKHMGRCGHFRIESEHFWTYGQHMGNIWGAYLIWSIPTATQANLSLPLLLQHPETQVKLPPSLCWKYFY